MKRFCTLGGVWLVTLLMTGCQDACDYQGYRDLPLIEVADGDTTDNTTNPGAVIVGTGTCADPLTQDGTWIAYMEGSGKIASFAKALSPEGCAKPSDVDGDADSEADAGKAGTQSSSRDRIGHHRLERQCTRAAHYRTFIFRRLRAQTCALFWLCGDLRREEAHWDTPSISVCVPISARTVSPAITF